MTAVSFAVYYRELVSDIGDFVMGKESNAIGDFMVGMKFYVFGGAVVSVAALVVMIVARWKTGRLRGVDEELYG
jgi:hypothetical protein